MKGFAFDAWTEGVLEAVEGTFRQLFDEHLEDVPGNLREAMEYTLLAGGKRIRALLLEAANQAIGGKAGKGIAAACALECIHAYSLIHDDLPAMDDDILRRGKPTSHIAFGEAMAILAGDALHSLSFELLSIYYNRTLAGELMAHLALGAGGAGMVGGQVLDLMAEGKIKHYAPARPNEPREFLRNIHRLKTGMLFEAAVRMGASCGTKAGSAKSDSLEALDAYANRFGMVFQITDDLIDAEGDAAAAGKETGKDAVKGKLTYPGLLGLEGSRLEVKRLTEEGLAALEVFEAKAEPLRELLRLLGNRKK